MANYLFTFWLQFDVDIIEVTPCVTLICVQMKLSRSRLLLNVAQQREASAGSSDWGLNIQRF
jgi:hypothetical protein